MQTSLFMAARAVHEQAVLGMVFGEGVWDEDSLKPLEGYSVCNPSIFRLQ